MRNLHWKKAVSFSFTNLSRLKLNHAVVNANHSKCPQTIGNTGTDLRHRIGKETNYVNAPYQKATSLYVSEF